MSIGTFGAFTQARLAIYAAQTGLTVTGNNISNINTEGYTRQRLDQTSLYTVGSDRYYAEGDVRVGQGVLVKSLSQIRSPYLDIRFRKEAASVGYMDKMLNGLNRIAATLDEVGKGDQSKEEDGFGVLALEFDKIRDAIEHLTEQTGHQEYDSSVRATCDALAKKFNTYANKLQQTYDETVNELHKNVEAINGHLDTIRSLNEEIRKCDIHGDNALELRDERNLEIDKLSQLIGIRVDYTMEDFSYGVQIEKLTISLNDHNPDGGVTTDETVLIDGVYGSHISIDQVPQPNPAAKYDPDNEDTWRFMKDDGTGNLVPTDSEDEAQKTRTMNPDPNIDWTPGANSDTNPWYLDEDGNPTADENASPIIMTPNPNYKPYLKEDGTPTDDPDEARMVDSPNFNITVSELRNKAGYLLYKNSKSPEIMLDHTADAAELAEALKVIADGGTKSEAADNGDITITKYRQALRENPEYSPLIPPYLNASGKPVAKPVDPKNPIPNPDYKPRYLDAAGNPTDDTAQAETVYYKTVITQVASKPVELDDNDLYGEIQAQRELLTEAGEFTDTDVISKDIQTGPYRNTDEKAASKRGIQYYQRALDLLANQFANAMNEANQGFALDKDGNTITEEVTGTAADLGLKTDPNGYYVDDLGNYVATIAHAPCIFNDFPLSANATEQEIQDYIAAHAPGDPDVTDLAGLLAKHGTQDGTAEVTAQRAIPMGGPLFSNNGATNDTENITAANISVSHMWQNTNNMLVRSYTCVPGTNEPASGDNKNLLHILHVMDVEKHDFIPSSLDSTKTGSDEIMFSGTFTDFWTEIGDVLGQDSSYTGTMLDTHYENALATDTNRDSVSAVDFNDEAMNLMMYAKSYNAACRLMTTIDSVLDKLVNNTGLTT